jgi:hypothetical protein
MILPYKDKFFYLDGSSNTKKFKYIERRGLVLRHTSVCFPTFQEKCWWETCFKKQTKPPNFEQHYLIYSSKNDGFSVFTLGISINAISKVPVPLQ